MRGARLRLVSVTVNGQTLALNYSSDRQVNELLPGNVSGLAKLTVANSQGMQTVNIFVEDAVPAIFTLDASGTGAAAVIRTGNFISLYLTGLGTSSAMPTVLLNGARDGDLCGSGAWLSRAGSDQFSTAGRGYFGHCSSDQRQAHEQYRDDLTVTARSLLT